MILQFPIALESLKAIRNSIANSSFIAFAYNKRVFVQLW